MISVDKMRITASLTVCEYLGIFFFLLEINNYALKRSHKSPPFLIKQCENIFLI